MRRRKIAVMEGGHRDGRPSCLGRPACHRWMAGHGWMARYGCQGRPGADDTGRRRQAPMQETPRETGLQAFQTVV